MSPEAQRALAADFEQWMRSWGASGRTIHARLALLRRLEDEWPDLRTVTTEQLGSWLASPDLKSKWSLITYHSHMRSLYGWMAETGHIETDPTLTLRRPKAPKDQPKPLTVAETAAVLAAAHGNVRAWLLLAFFAGLRAHEIAKIAGEDVQEDRIFVAGKGDVEAFIPTHRVLWVLAQQYPRTGWWFPSHAHAGHISGDSVTIMTGKLFREVGIAKGAVHRARHTYATGLLHSGANIEAVRKLMRHSSLATTAAYIAVDDEELRAAVNRLGGAA